MGKQQLLQHGMQVCTAVEVVITLTTRKAKLVRWVHEQFTTPFSSDSVVQPLVVQFPKLSVSMCVCVCVCVCVGGEGGRGGGQ